MNKRFLVVLTVIVSIAIFCCYQQYNKNNEIYESSSIKRSKNMFSMLFQTSLGSNIYEEQTGTTWPTSGYIFNSEKSGCEHGSILTWDDVNKKVVITGNISDKCYVYFDIEPPELMVTVNNLPTTAGKLATVSATGATMIYNNKLNRLEISDLTTEKMSASLSFSNATGTTPLNTYITGLAGTTQGDGKVVHEVGEAYDFTNATPVTSYGTTPAYFKNTADTSTTRSSTAAYWTFDSTTGTFTSDPTIMTTAYNAYYHAYAQIPSNGYYQLCYTIEESYILNKLNISINTTSVAQIGVSSSQMVSGCYDLGFLTTSDYINVSELAKSTTVPVMTFRLEKSNNVSSIDTGYRYEGKNPNNYVMFNNELWRIIGVFDASNHGQTGKNLVKIIRNDSIGTLSWNKTNKNDWNISSLKALLNGAYYNHTVDTTNCYSFGYRNVTSTCDYRIKGIQSNYQGMIENVTWYLGGHGKEGYNSNYFGNIYGYERNSNSVYDGNSTTTTGKIGLIYASDFISGVLASDCARTTSVDSYGNDYNLPCSSNNWLFLEMWTITHKNTGVGLTYQVSTRYNFYSTSSYYYAGTYPVLYLSTSVYKVSGTGTITDPYIIGM